MWHASVSAINDATAWGMASRALQGIGDAALGEWRERGSRRGIVHIRRRLTAAEREVAGGLGVRDVRGTVEERLRIRDLLRDAPHLRGMLS